jgi:hypothetical protein
MNMPYEISYDSESGILSTRVTGQVDMTLVKAMSNDMRAETVKHGCTRFLNDYRSAMISLRILDIYQLPKLAELLGTDPAARHAIVVKGETDSIRFFVTVARNRGQLVRVFTDMDQARAWLLS